MRHWGQLAIANPVAFLATLMLGALLAFVYSYVPLHTVKHRKLERLEHTLLVHEETIASLESELEGARMAASELSQDEALASLESERDEARRNADAARRELKTAEKRAQGLERERNDWKRKVAALERRTAQAANQRLAEASCAACLARTLNRRPSDVAIERRAQRPEIARTEQVDVHQQRVELIQGDAFAPVGGERVGLGVGREDPLREATE
jgi:chromosome segregation ATPase